jgi:hypothetical protein
LAALVAVLLLVHGGYGLWTAKRLDRLHRRRDAAAVALDAQLRRRASTALAFARLRRGVRFDAVADAAQSAFAVAGLGHDREAAENDLSRALHGVAADADDALVDQAMKAAIARRFHNDTVRDSLVVRRRRIVRWFRLAGRAPLPGYFEMDDNALAGRRTIDV